MSLWHDFQYLRRDITAHSRALSLWGKILNIPAFLGGVTFMPDPAAIAVALAIVVSLLIAVEIHKRAPLSRLMGLCHVVFLPALWFLWQAGLAADGGTVFLLWVWLTLTLMAVSVVLDVRSIFQYFAGNRTYN